MAIISCGTKLCLGLNFKLSGSFNSSSGKQVCVNISLLELVSSVVISLCPPLPPHLRHIKFSVQGVLVLANWEDIKMRLNALTAHVPFPSSFFFSSLFLETQQISSCRCWAYLALICHCYVSSEVLLTSFLKLVCIHSPSPFPVTHSVLSPLCAATTRDPNHNSRFLTCLCPLVPWEGGRDLSVWESRCHMGLRLSPLSQG